MANTEMLARLRDMHQQLEAINDDQQLPDKVDDETVEALGQLVTDVGNILDSMSQKTNTDDQPPAIGEDDENDLRDRILQLESDHPRVAQFLNQFSDLLGNMGI